MRAPRLMAAVASAAAVALTAALASCSLFDYSSMTSKRYALVYGVTTYVSATELATRPAGVNDPNLSYPANDAKSVAEMFAAQGYTVISRWVDENGEVFKDGLDLGANIATDPSQAPTAANITADVDSLSSSVGQNDVVVFYFSGHGMPDSTSSPTHEWIIPYDGIVYDSVDNWYYGNPSTSIEDNQLGGILAAAGTSRRVVILDTCNSGGFIGNRVEVDTTPPVSAGTWAIATPLTLIQAMVSYLSFPLSPGGISPYGGAMVISAAGAAESCYETPSYAHGVMTNFLLQCPESGDLNKDGKVTVAEAFSLVKSGIDNNWNKDAGNILSGETFEPHISGGPVDFVLF